MPRHMQGGPFMAMSYHPAISSIISIFFQIASVNSHVSNVGVFQSFTRRLPTALKRLDRSQVEYRGGSVAHHSHRVVGEVSETHSLRLVQKNFDILEILPISFGDDESGNNTEDLFRDPTDSLLSD